MGATPILGLAIAAFPTDKLPLDVLEEILRGGADKAAEAGFPIAGGHTIIDDVPKYGLAVTGIVSRRQARAQLHGASRRRALSDQADRQRHPRQRESRASKLLPSSQPPLDEAIRWMTMLNRDAAKAMVEAGAARPRTSPATV